MTHLHSKLEKEKCMDLFLIDGNAEKRAIQLQKIFRRTKTCTLWTGCALDCK